MSYRIFVNATLDLNQAMLDDCSSVVIIPFQVQIGQELYTYVSNGNLSIYEFYNAQCSGEVFKLLPMEMPVYYEIFDKWLSQGNDILYLMSSSFMLPETILKIHQLLEKLREKYKERKIVCIDTFGISIGEGLLVWEAAKKQAEGMDMELLAQWVQNDRLKVCQWFAINTFEHLIQDEIEMPFLKEIENLFRVNPLLGVDEVGKLILSEKLNGSPKTMYSMFSRLERGWKPELGNKIIIGYADCKEYAEDLRKSLSYEWCIADIVIAELGPAIGIYTGSESLAIAYWGGNRLDDKKRR